MLAGFIGIMRNQWQNSLNSRPFSRRLMKLILEVGTGSDSIRKPREGPCGKTGWANDRKEETPKGMATRATPYVKVHRSVKNHPIRAIVWKIGRLAAFYCRTWRANYGDNEGRPRWGEFSHPGKTSWSTFSRNGLPIGNSQVYTTN